MPEPMLATASPSFYRRPLPSSCAAFSSAEGKRYFAQAMAEGNLESYFALAGQFLTQNEPAFCALGTLCMVLNALEVDPQRKWRDTAPWRWYDQEMLSCCRPLNDVARVGLTLNEFACLARCNGLSATVTSPSLDSSAKAEGLANFRRDLKLASTGQTTMALSYSRKTLGQTGDGHFSCVGAYSEKDDMVLILDVARFKYPSYWISVNLAYESMLPLDKATGQPRGYSLLTPLPEADPSSLLAPVSLTTLTLNKSSWASVSNDITKLLLSFPKATTASTLLRALANYITSLPTEALSARPPASPSITTDLLPLFARTRLSSMTDSPNPLLPLFFLALFSPKSSLTRLIPLSAKNEVQSLLDEALEKGGEMVRGEVEVLVRQLGALGECCRAEEDAGAACGCAGVGKKGAEVEM